MRSFAPGKSAPHRKGNPKPSGINKALRSAGGAPGRIKRTSDTANKTSQIKTRVKNAQDWTVLSRRQPRAPAITTKLLTITGTTRLIQPMSTESAGSGRTGANCDCSRACA